MPKLTGVFENFKDLDRIPISDIHHWLKAKEMDYYLENYIGNRMLYPQTVAVTSYDMDVDLAILREYIKRHSESFYNTSVNHIIVPEEFVPRFAPITVLMSAYLDVLKVENPVTTITLKRDNEDIVAGSLIIPQKKFKEDFIEVSIDDQGMRYKVGSMHLIPIQDTQVKIRFKDSEDFFVPGGSIGVLLDLRTSDEEKI